MVDHNSDKSGQPRLAELIPLKEAAELSRLSYSHIRKLAREETIWAQKLGNTWLTTARAAVESKKA